MSGLPVHTRRVYGKIDSNIGTETDSNQTLNVLQRTKRRRVGEMSGQLGVAVARWRVILSALKRMWVHAWASARRLS